MAYYPNEAQENGDHQDGRGLEEMWPTGGLSPLLVELQKDTTILGPYFERNICYNKLIFHYIQS